MTFNSNLEDIIKKLQTVATRSEALDFSAALTAGLNAAMSKMKFRVFNTGHDTKGVSFGKYIGKKSRATKKRFGSLPGDDSETLKTKKKLSKRLLKNADPSSTYTEYEKKRLSIGRQVKYKDLDFRSDLRKAIKVAKQTDTRVVIWIDNAKLKQIAQYQSEQISRIVGQKVLIFGLSAEERETLSETTNELLNQLYARLFNT